MTVEKMKSVRALRAAIASKQEQRARLRSAMEGMTQTLALAPGGGAPQTLEDKMIRLLDLEDELAMQIIALEEAIRSVEQWMEGLPPNEAMVMRLRYIDGLPWRQVAKQTHYTADNCMRINGKCMQSLQQNTV